MVLAFRPLLLLQVELQKHKLAQGEKLFTIHHKAPLLLDSREHCINAARSIISFSESVLFTVSDIQAIPLFPHRTTPHVLTWCQGLCNHGYFLESACFVLVLAATHDGVTAASSHAHYITRGLACLRKLVQREPIPSVVAALERMLGKLSQGNALLEPTAANLGVAESQRENAAGLQAGATETIQMGELEMLPDLHAQQGGVPEGGIWPDADQEMLASADGNGVLEDFELPNMDWGIDFSLLDVEEFVSVMGMQPAFSSFH